MSTKELITIPKADKDLLIIPASFRRYPSASVYFDRSEPARSIIWKQALFIYQTPEAVMVFDSIYVVRTE